MPFGIAIAILSGVLNGSFAAPMKKNETWEWENTWLVYALVALVILPLLIAFLFVPGLFDIFRATPRGVVWRTVLLGAGYGFGSLTFGVGLHLLGLSLGYSIIIGIIAVAGSLFPMIVQASSTVFTTGGLVIIAAALVTVGGVALCGSAGRLRDVHLPNRQTQTSGRSRFKLALLVCILSGLFSAMLNFAFHFGSPIAEVTKSRLGDGATAFQINHPVWCLALWGAFVPNLLYCGYLLLSKKSWKEYFSPPEKMNWFRSVLMGVLWIGCISLYGAGASSIGRLGTTVGWLILMAVTVFVGNLWGIGSGEWREAPKEARFRMAQGLMLLLGAVALVALGKSLL